METKTEKYLTADEFITLTNVLGPARVKYIADLQAQVAAATVRADEAERTRDSFATSIQLLTTENLTVTIPRMEQAEAERDAAIARQNEAERGLREHLDTSPVWISVEDYAAVWHERDALRATVADASEKGYLGHSGSCQGPYGGDCRCGFSAWLAEREALAAARKEVKG